MIETVTISNRLLVCLLGGLLWVTAGACRNGHVVPRDGSPPSDLPVVPGIDAVGNDADGGEVGIDAPGPEVAGSLECGAGQHACAGVCVRNDDPRTCGTSCSPCDPVPDGTASCDGIRCGATCSSGKTLCLGSCVDSAGASCTGGCLPGTHPCSGQCPSNQSLNACGTSCDPCPVPAGAAQATCDGLRCDFQCLSQYHRCGDRCARDDDATACGLSCQSCPADPLGSGVPQCVGGICSLRCSSGFHACNGRCVSDTSPDTCGTSCDACPIPTGGTATCDLGHCGGRCQAAQKLCGGTCIDSSAPCAVQCAAGTHDCGGACSLNTSVNSCGPTSCQACPRPTGAVDVTCAAGACDFTCGSGYHRCGSACVADDNPAGCGAACTVCASDPNGVAICLGGACNLRCNVGFHVCQGRCVSNSATATCGPISCDPCQAPTGGIVTCDGLACVPACPGAKLCNGGCIDNGLACNGMCLAGTHVCTGACLSNTSPGSCGGRCSPCPDPPSRGVASCTGGLCGVTCDPTFKNCPGTSLCVPMAGCCAGSECTAGGTGTVGTCTSANTCSYACNAATHKMCGSVCIPLASCCMNGDCPGASPICNLTTRACEKRPNGANCTTQGECASGTCLTCFPDADGDGFSNKWNAVPTGLFCGACPAGSSADHTDCLDLVSNANAVAVNPNATFSGTAYVPDPADPTPDGFDWNCNDTIERGVGLTASGIPMGCAAGSSCEAGCVQVTGTVAVPQGCGDRAGGSACAAVCGSPPPAPHACMNITISTVQMTCR